MIYSALKKYTQQLLLLLLIIYGCCVSRFLPCSCRFYPSCSQYSHDAIKEHGSLRGILMTLMRLLRCHPLHKGGFDPVPKRNSSAHHEGCNNRARFKINAYTNNPSGKHT